MGGAVHQSRTGQCPEPLRGWSDHGKAMNGGALLPCSALGVFPSQVRTVLHKTVVSVGPAASMPRAAQARTLNRGGLGVRMA